MKSQALAFMAESPLMVLPLAALLLFLTVFAAVIGRLVWRGAGAYAQLEQLPLEEGGRDE